ncbi:hypothetical protein F8M41_002007 [Gigaspora margarita]|uniref:Uncharacterized protein n=1 Tax=Gigaspora margarita TaxID=4874 RepID=A0A8H3XEZ3_GIGMA|nr:hypothetical protein F8M41_002007 [Gigaspora margarita]
MQTKRPHNDLGHYDIIDFTAGKIAPDCRKTVNENFLSTRDDEPKEFVWDSAYHLFEDQEHEYSTERLKTILRLGITSSYRNLVTRDLEIREGMSFLDFDNAEQYVRQYADFKGFKIRLDHSMPRTRRQLTLPLSSVRISQYQEDPPPNLQYQGTPPPFQNLSL